MLMAKLTKAKIIQGLGLLLFLVVLPGGSWYYLKSGLDYRRAVLKDLSDYGPVPGATFASQNSELVAALPGKVLVSAFVPDANSSAADQQGALLKKLHDQFDEREEVLFLAHLADSTSGFAQKYQLTDTAQCFFVLHSREDLLAAAEKEYKLPTGADPASWIVLSDIQGNMRRQYDVSQPEEVKRLVEHIAMLMPVAKREKVMVRRDAEK